MKVIKEGDSNLEAFRKKCLTCNSILEYTKLDEFKSYFDDFDFDGYPMEVLAKSIKCIKCGEIIRTSI